MLNAPRRYVDEIYLSIYLSVITYAPSEERRTDDVTYFARTFEVIALPSKAVIKPCLLTISLVYQT